MKRSDLLKEKIIGVYKILCLINNKFYIGGSKDIEYRLKCHRRNLNHSKHINPYLQYAWNKYGEDNFTFAIVEYVENKEILPDREQWWLDETQCYNNDIGFNVRDSVGLRVSNKINQERKEKQLNRLREILNRYKTLNNLPLSSSLNTQERKDAEWIQSRKRAKQGTNTLTWHPEFEQIANDASFQGMFDITDTRLEKINRLYQIIDRYKSKEFLPSQYSKNPIEKDDGKWILMQKCSKNGTNSCVWIPDLDTIAIKYGFENIFDFYDHKKECIRRLNQIICHHKTIENLYCDEINPKETDMPWIRSMRRNKKNNKNWYSELEDIANAHGFINLFETQDGEFKKIKAIERLNEIIDRYKSKSNLPIRKSNKTQYSCLQEKKDAEWINCRAKAKKRSILNIENNHCLWYPILDKIAQNYNFEGMFDSKKKDIETTSIIRLNQIIEVYKTLEHFQCCKNCHQKEIDHAWIRSLKIKKRKGKLFPELEMIANSNGFSGLFDTTIDRRSKSI